MPDSPQTPRDALEARLTALLLGELSADESALLRQAIAQDTELARLHDRLKLAVELVRETAASPEQQSFLPADAPKLSAERREKMLRSFKTLRAKGPARARWRNVSWRDWAALAAMFVGLFGLASLFLTWRMNSPNMAGKDRSGELDWLRKKLVTVFGDDVNGAQGITALPAQGQPAVAAGEAFFMGRDGGVRVQGGTAPQVSGGGRFLAENFAGTPAMPPATERGRQIAETPLAVIGSSLTPQPPPPPAANPLPQPRSADRRNSTAEELAAWIDLSDLSDPKKSGRTVARNLGRIALPQASESLARDGQNAAAKTALANDFFDHEAPATPANGIVSAGQAVQTFGGLGLSGFGGGGGSGGRSVEAGRAWGFAAPGQPQTPGNAPQAGDRNVPRFGRVEGLARQSLDEGGVAAGPNNPIVLPNAANPITVEAKFAEVAQDSEARARDTLTRELGVLRADRGDAPAAATEDKGVTVAGGAWHRENLGWAVGGPMPMVTPPPVPPADPAARAGSLPTGRRSGGTGQAVVANDDGAWFNNGREVAQTTPVPAKPASPPPTSPPAQPGLGALYAGGVLPSPGNKPASDTAMNLGAAYSAGGTRPIAPAPAQTPAPPAPAVADPKLKEPVADGRLGDISAETAQRQNLESFLAQVTNGVALDLRARPGLVPQFSERLDSGANATAFGKALDPVQQAVPMFEDRFGKPTQAVDEFFASGLRDSAQKPDVDGDRGAEYVGVSLFPRLKAKKAPVLEEKQLAGVSDAPVGGVYSQNAVGYANVESDKSKSDRKAGLEPLPAAKPESARPAVPVLEWRTKRAEIALPQVRAEDKLEHFPNVVINEITANSTRQFPVEDLASGFDEFSEPARSELPASRPGEKREPQVMTGPVAATEVQLHPQSEATPTFAQRLGSIVNRASSGGVEAQRASGREKNEVLTKLADDKELKAREAEKRSELERLSKLHTTLTNMSRDEFRRAITTASPDAQLAQLLGDVSTAEQGLAKLAEEYGSDHPDVNQLRQLKERINNQTDSDLVGVISGLRAKIEVARHEAEQTPASPSSRKEELRRQLDSIRLPELRSDSLPLAAVIELLKEEVAKADPAKKGINVILNSHDPAVDGIAPVETVTGLPFPSSNDATDLGATTIRIPAPMRNVTLGQALDAISKAADRPVNIAIEDYGVVLSAGDSKSKTRDLQSREANWSQILDNYQELTGRTVLRPNSLPETKISINSPTPLSRDEAIRALDSALSLNQITMIPQGEKFVKAMPEGQAGAAAAQFNDLPAELLPEGGVLTTMIYKLTNAVANDVVPAIQPFAKLSNGIVAIPDSGIIVVRDYAQNVHRIEELLKKIDVVPHSDAKPDDTALHRQSSAPVPQPEVATAGNAFSTFSLNVSDVSFKLAAASLEKGQMPDPATVRSEEFINAFDYRDPEPAGNAPIAFAWERARYPFAHDRDLVRFSVKTAASGRQPGRPLNLVLLLDNSGSMERADRVRIRQECLRVLAGQLRPEDRVSVVAFARTARLWVDGLPGSQAGELPQRVGNLAPEGGTNLEDAMNVAYQTALKHFLPNGVNRVVLLTDGAANLGDVQPESLKKKVEAHRQQGVALDCFGIGWDGLNDELLEALSRNGDGRYGFVNTPEAAQNEFARQLAGALKVAASDVKVQVEWNPRRVTAYRQIGYAKHQLKKEQFRDNTVDAAEIGAAEAGNALYTVQVNPRGEGPLGTVRVRFKVPGTSDYREHEWPLAYDGGAKSLDQSSAALRLAASASAFSEWLVSSPFAAEVTPDKLLGYLRGVPETCPADPRPKKLEWMIRQAKGVAGK